MRATWFSLACQAVLVLSPLPGLAAPAKGEALKPGTKLIFGQAWTRSDFEMIRGFTAMGLRMEEEATTATQDNPVPEGTVVPWEALPVYSPLPPPGAASSAGVPEALRAVRTFYISSSKAELNVMAGFPAPLSRSNLEVDLDVSALRDAKRRKVRFSPREGLEKAVEDNERLVPARLKFNLIGPLLGEFPEDLQGWTGAGVAKVRMPARYRVVSFTAADVGTTREGFTLKSWKGSVVELQDDQARLLKRRKVSSPWKLDPESAVLVGLTAEGRRLQAGEPYIDEPVKRETMVALVKLPWEEVPAEVPEPPAMGRKVVRQPFAGALARLDVYVAEGVKQHKVPFRIVSAPPGTDPLLRLPAEAPPRALCEVSAGSLAKEVRIFASRLDASPKEDGLSNEHHGRPAVAAQLPVCDNTWFSDMTLSGLKYLDASGNPVPAEPVSGKSRRRAWSFGHELFFRKPGEASPPADAAFRELARIEGVARITVPRLRVLSLTRRAPRAEGAELLIQGQQVRLRLPEALHARLARADGVADHLRDVTAYDAKGRLVRREGASEPSTSGGQVEQVFRLHGKAERIDLLLVEEQVQHEQPFSVSLAPAPELPPGKKKQQAAQEE